MKRKVQKRAAPLVWVTQDHRAYRIQDMATEHIRNASAMIERNPMTHMSEKELIVYCQKIQARRRQILRAFRAELKRRAAVNYEGDRVQ